MKESKVNIKYNGKDYSYSAKQVDHSMSTAFNQKDKVAFENCIKILVNR